VGAAARDAAYTTGTLPASAKLSLRSLTIHRYEQFRDCPRVELSPDDNLILGINGSGKTSLLRLLAAVLRWNYDALLGQPFDIEFEQVLEVDGADTRVSIEGQVRYQPAQPAVKQQSQGRRVVRSKYEGFKAQFDIHHNRGSRCTVRVDEETMHVMVEGSQEQPAATSTSSWIAGGFASMMKALVESDDPLVGDLLVRAVYDLDDVVSSTFVVRETDIDFAQLTEHISYRYSLFSIVDREALPEVEIRQWFPLLVAVVAGAAERQKDHGYFAPVAYERDAQASFWPHWDMRALLAALDAQSISFRPEIQKTEKTNEGARLEGKGVEIRVRFPSGTEIIDAGLTFGQKRLITIALGALSCGGSPLLVDEIDNGLHPGLLEKTLELIRGRQTFIASHNKLVVDLLDYDSPEDICRTIHICRRNPDGTQSLVALSDDQVHEVFEKIEVGIMNPSDVLLREGLW
jgi:energy-coupling factor transporter ATP-binding protein EcfA2